jgi:DNA-binding response OmpR family regulator
VGRSRSTILVVDDEPSIRLLCRINLQLEGYRVLEAATLSDARTALETQTVDAILLDQHVGGERGSDFLRELRDTESRTPVAFLTGSESVPESDLAGADGVLSKPFTLAELSRTVQRLVSHDVDAPIS